MAVNFYLIIDTSLSRIDVFNRVDHPSQDFSEGRSGIQGSSLDRADRRYKRKFLKGAGQKILWKSLQVHFNSLSYY
jgi:hypothetical protein